ncbi:MAG: enoyl-CoA hydratase/isomerase family protein [Nitrospirae bacterium]|nr:enoyl-CoA hydratase/isomerase family protein [Nitrospirota bacterium]
MPIRVTAQVVVKELIDGCFEVRLNRPEKRNALSIEVREEAAEVFQRLAEDEACTAVVLSGEGPAFCAGMDFTQFGGGPGNKVRLLESTQALFTSLLGFPKPIIAAVHGAAVGGGFALALTCDVRIASEGAFFGFFEVKRGIPAFFDLVRLFVGEEVARDWCTTGRRIEAAELLRLGVVKRMAPQGSLMDEAIREAGETRARGLPPGIVSVFAEEHLRFRNALFPGEYMGKGI